MNQKIKCSWCQDEGCSICRGVENEVLSYGNPNPEVVIVLPFPEYNEVINKKYLSGHRSPLKSALGSDITKCFITAIVKSVKLTDQIAKVGIKKPTETELNFGLSSLQSELDKIPKRPVIMSVGSVATKTFGITERFENTIGKEYEWKGYRVIPQYEPAYLIYKPRLAAEFNEVNKKVFQPPVPQVDPQFITVDYEEACFQITRVLEKFKKGEIDSFVFDSETTSFDAWSGKIIMYSWASDGDEAGYAFPLVVNNEITMKPEKFIDYVECSEELYELIEKDHIEFDIDITCMNTISREDLKTWSVFDKRKRTEDRKRVKEIKENHTSFIFEREKEKLKTDIVVTDAQIDKFNLLLGQVIKEVPIVGHNLKFDVKFLHEHDVAHFRDITVKDDTLIMAFMIFNKGFGISNSLESLTVKYFGVSWKGVVHAFLGRYGKIVDRHYGNLPTSILAPYAARDAYYNLKVYHKLKQDLPINGEYITEISTKAITLFSEVELKGLKVDWGMYEFLKSNYEATCAEMVKKMESLQVVQGYLKKNKEFNAGSPDQLRDMLFSSNYYDLPSIKTKKFITDKNLPPSHPKQKQKTDKVVVPFFHNWLDECDSGIFQERVETLLTNDEKLTKEDQYCLNHVSKRDPEVLDRKYTECTEFLTYYRRWKRIGGKLIPTYIKPVPERSPNGLYRTDFKINGTDSGRLASGFHTMDKGSEITRMFISRWEEIGGLILAVDFCLEGNTEIKMVDGTIKKIKDLVGLEEFFVYSYDKSTGRNEVGRAHSCRMVRKTKEMIRIKLDTGGEVTCTPEHKFMLNDSKEFREAKDLKVYEYLHNTGYKTPDKIISIERVNLEEEVETYCFTVDEFHNFYLANGILSSNSQLELRTAASLADEKVLIDAYKKDIDLHRLTASKVYKIKPEEVTHAQRQYGKLLNFFVLYGGSAATLRDELKIPIEEAQTMLDNFFEGYPNIRKYIDKQVSLLEQTGKVVTVWNRHVPIPDINSPKEMIKQHAIRKGGNLPIQSTASDCVLYSVVRINEELKKRKLKSLIIASVHDSIEFDIYPKELFEVMQISKEICEVELQKMHSWITCPLKISGEMGSSWGGCFEFDIDHLDKDNLTIIGEGLRKDFLTLNMNAKNAYDINIEVLKDKPLTEKDFGKEYYFKDTSKWEAKVTFRSNNAPVNI